jgi:hypothetical protein
MGTDATPASEVDGDADASDTSVEDASDSSFDADATDAMPPPSAVCARLAGAKYDACLADPRFRACFPRSIDDLRVFYRGACRDGAKWSAEDAGTDTDTAADSD